MTEQHPSPTETAAPQPLPRRRDPGSPLGARIALLVAIPFFVAVATMQQCQAFAVPTPEKKEAPAEITPPADDTFLVLSRLYVRLAELLPSDSKLGAQLTGELAPMAQREVDKLRLAMVEAELVGDEAALARVRKVQEGLDPDDPLRADAEALSRLLEQGPASIEPERLEAWAKRHGWFGDLALVLDEPDESPARQAIVGGGGAVVALGAAVAVALLIGAVGGLAGIITLIVWWVSRRPRPLFAPPAPGGSVYLEMFAIFVAGFIALQFVGALVAQMTSERTGMTFGLVAQWLLLGVVLWPVLRGVPWGQVRDDLGLRAPRGRGGRGGAAREGLVGVWMYFAGLPLFYAAVVITMVVVMVYSELTKSATGEPAPPPRNPVLELFGEAGPLQFLLAAALAVVWAPLVEEIVFRGALYRHVRSRAPALLAAPLVAVLFGLMHGYMILMLLPVITLGLIFAMMREWRGSIVPSITAHALHNGTIVVILALAVRAIS
jgi:membrane protease YdiL (CAAX protease family)